MGTVWKIWLYELVKILFFLKGDIMSKVDVVYWSGTGNTAAMADAVAKGATNAGAEVTCADTSTFDSSKLSEYSGVALGCPAMGAEQLDDAEFEPFYESIKGSLGGKKVGLFGSYGWGDGEWMRTWQADARDSGLSLVMDGVIAHEAPDDTAVAECESLGAALV